MPLPVQQDSPGKFQRYRASRKAKGQKLLRLWVLDPRSPIFLNEARRQAYLLRSAPEEDEALDFIETTADFGDEPR